MVPGQQTVIHEEQLESIPYNHNSHMSMEASHIKGASALDFSDEEEAEVFHPAEEKAWEQDVIEIKVTDASSFVTNEIDKIAYRYMFWACSRGNMFIVLHILQSHGISPFMSETENKMTPFLSAVENNCVKVVRLLLSKTYHCP